MTKVTVEMNDKLSTALDDLAKEQATSKADIIRRGITLLQIVEEQGAEGYKFGFSKSGELEKEILLG